MVVWEAKKREYRGREDLIVFAYFVLVNQCSIGGLGWWFGILGVPLSTNPFHKGIPGIPTTNPNHQVTFFLDI